MLVITPALAHAAPNGGSDTLGRAGGPAKTWYFAEGTTRSGFAEYVCLLNPSSGPARADFEYMLGTGETVKRSYELAPSSRTTVNVMTEVPAESDVSIKVSSEQSLIAERPMYFTYQGAWTGGHDVMGATAPQSDWYFAEGTTRSGFDTYICVQNPGDATAMVDLDYYLVSGQTVSRKAIEVKPRSRFTIAAHDNNLGIGRHDDSSGDFSFKISTAKDTPVVAERATYFNYAGSVSGGHDVVGAAAPEKDWYFAEGTTRSGFDTYVCIANPGKRDATVDLNYFCGDGKSIERKGIAVKAGSRFTVAAHDDNLGIGRHNDSSGDFSLKVSSLQPVVAERTSYFTYRPFWTGGTAVVGAPEPAEQWYFAEGCTRQGFDTYLCLANPGEAAAKVDVTYFRGDNQTEAKNGIEIGAHSRVTIPVHDGSLGIGRRDDNSGDVSMKVVSTNKVPVVAERPMYFADRWRTMDKNAIAGAWHWGNRVYGNKSRPWAALTFDCERGASSTNLLLDVLEQKGARATCFLLANVAANSDVVRRIANDGFEMGNHGTSHPQFTKISADRVVSELRTTEVEVNNATGGLTTKPYFRFPGGEMNPGLVAQVNSLGYMSIYWSVDPQDWNAKNSAQAVINTVVGQTGPGAIVLMHDTAKTAQALPAIIDGLRARGLTLVTLSELFYPGP